jgi:hypothetical protein
MALNMVHEPEVHKPDIGYGMVAGDVCADCVARLKKFGTSPDAVDSLQDP